MVDVYQYKDYDEYVKVQTEISHLKKDWVYIKPRVVKAVLESKSFPGNILCHGVRNGTEVLMFLGELPYAQVTGTEIAPGCESLFNSVLTKHKNKFPRIPHKHHGSVVLWDMQKENSAWINKFDIVYTNSFDHCIYPEETLKIWRDQCNPNGSVFIEYSEQQSIGNKDDPLGASFDEVKEMMQKVFSNVSLLGVTGKSGSRVLRGDK